MPMFNFMAHPGSIYKATIPTPPLHFHFACVPCNCPTMRTSLFLWLFLISHSLFCISSISAYSQCLDHERTLLLQLKNSLTFDSPYSTKLVSWKNQSTDCCHWDGVACDDVGHVIGLDLNDESISGGIYNSRSLFGLQYLERLNLAYNHFHGAQIPSGFDKLANLAYLNMSYSGFVGQIPIEISHMTRLVTLDLSTYGLELKNPNLMVLVRNLTELRELHLDGVNIWAQGYEWCQALSSLSNLQVLGLSGCGLSGPIDSSLMKLQSLSVIRLDGNNFSAPFPEFFADFSNMTALHLHSSGFYGKVPERIFQIPTVQVLDLSYNELLEGFFPDSVLNLTQIVYLDLSRTRFTGPIPSFRMSKNLIHIDLSSNNFTGNVPSTHFDGLVNLVYIDLRYNSFNGNIPSSLFTLPSLSIIYLSSNQFEGQVAEFPNASSSVLEALDMYNNTLDGPIPLSIFELRRLKHLDLSYNNFSGTIQFEMIQRLSNLIILYLSNNNLSIDASGSNSSSSSFPQFGWLGLASCKLQNFPDLKNQSSLYYLDLSNNQIDGEIPNWIWEVGNGGLFFVNLSHNLLVQLQEPYSFRTSLEYLNLHSNQLHGKIPIPPPEAMFVDYSSNNFSYSIPANIGNYLTNALWFSLSNNSLSGVIPESICEGSSLQLLDLSNNNLNSTIPSCLFERMSDSLEVLNLQGNNLHGNISGTFPSNCSLQTLDLNGNHLEGWVPESLTNCKRLELLNLGDNKINDTFPCWLENLSSLRIMVLRSNRFHGHIGCLDANHSWPVLQIIDIASNSFSGDLPRRCFLNWRAMMVVKNEEPPTLSDVVMFSGGYYQNTVTVSNKGQSMELEKILTIFTSIDFSSNSFQGEIPEAIGNLKSLLVLNLSHNDLDGRIPPSIGNLRQLESLDLSDNKLRGEIPAQLATLTFLSCLNLSYNQLVGMIPRGTQFQTFTETTFEGNKGLCGPPLNRSCNNTTMAGLPPPRIGDRHSYPTNEINWNWISAELGFVTGLGSIVGSLLFCKRWRRWYYKHVDRVLLRILPGRVNHRRRAYRNPIRRL